MSAVIYAAIVVMWAVVLVPMWLRRHDAATESRSVDRFSTAMRTLSRRTTSAPGRRYVVMPRRADGVTVHVSGAAAAVGRFASRSAAADRAAPPAAPARPVAAPVARPARRPASLVARRRRWLLGLLALTVLTGLLAVAGVLSWALQLVVDVILVAFCIHLRKQARRALADSRARQDRAPRPARPSAPVARPQAPASPVTAAAATRAAREVPVAPVASEAAVETVELDPVETAVAATGTDDRRHADEDTWQPVPVPPPTYSMKPPAPAYQADPTYTDPVYAPSADQPAAAAYSDDDAVDSDLDDILERRWAVND